MLSEVSSDITDRPPLETDVYILPHSVPPPLSVHFNSDSDSLDGNGKNSLELRKNIDNNSNISIISNEQPLISPEPLEPVASLFKTPNTSRAYLDSILNSDPNCADSVSMHAKYSSAESTDESSAQAEEETSTSKSDWMKKKKSKKTEQKQNKKSVKPNPCLNKKCGNDCGVKLTEEDRLAIHQYYWSISDKKMRKKWLVSCVKPKNIRRKRTTSNFRQVSYDYIVNYQGKDVKVCQQFLLKTLDISQMTLRYAVLKSGVISTSKDDKIDQPNNESEEAEIAALKTFIEKLPKTSLLNQEELLSQLKQKIMSS